MSITFNKINAPGYNLNSTLLGGQAFSWTQTPDGYFTGFTHNSIIKVKQVTEDLMWQTFPNHDDYDLLRNYLNLDSDHTKIITSISKDAHVKRAYEYIGTMHITKQPLKQTILSFIISANNNINSVRRAVHYLAETYGKKVNVGTSKIALFPSTEILANLTEKQLFEIKIGYRAKHLQKAAQQLLAMNIESQILEKTEDEARSILESIHGVGPKVADCILVYGLGYHSTTPIDLWAFRMLHEFYGLPENISYTKAREFLKRKFKENTAWAGQYLFEYIRKTYVR